MRCSVEITPKKLQELADAPFGKAKEYIQQNHDPLWGKEVSEDETQKYTVTLRVEETSVVEYTVIVEAHDEEEAELLAADEYNAGRAGPSIAINDYSEINDIRVEL